MARKVKNTGEPEEDPELDISSLIDVSFLLLIYFLVTSTLQPKETDLGVTLPADAPADQPVKLKPFTIKIKDDGEISVDGEILEQAGGDKTVPNLLKKVGDYASAFEGQEKNKPIVIVAADDEAVQQRFIDVVNALAKVDITNVTLTGFREDS